MRGMNKVEVIKLRDTKYASSLERILNKYVSFGSCTLEYAQSLILDHKAYVFLLEEEIIACSILYTDNRSRHEVKHVVVEETYRGQGLAKGLIRFLLEDNPDKELHATGWVTPHGWEAERLFLSNGFKIVQHDLQYWQNDCTSYDYCPHRTDNCNCSAKLVTNF
jgi:N-acetylglutamate synthase-like GNAT family acetyltransferase